MRPALAVDCGVSITRSTRTGRRGAAGGGVLQPGRAVQADVDPGEVVAALVKYAGRFKGKTSEHLRLLRAGADGNSDGELHLVSELVRRGIGNVEDAVAGLIALAGSGGRDKVCKRTDYPIRTAERAARDVLKSIELGQFDKRQFMGWLNLPGGAGEVMPVKISDELAAALEKSGDELTYAKGGRLETEVGNVIVLFRNDPQLRGLLGHNEWASRDMRKGSWRLFDPDAADKAGTVTMDDITRLRMWLRRKYGMRFEGKELAAGVEAAALGARFNPVADRLNALSEQWDGVQRVDSWLTALAKIDDTGCAEYVSTVGRAFLVGAVARALSPGCQMDTVLSVEGSGGGGKSTMFRVLAEAVGAGLFADGIHDVSSKASLVEGTGGRWIVELAELAGVRRAADVEALKAALTRTTDSFRKPYGLAEVDYPRGFVFVATTNRNQYLADSSGALLRRFWPVRTRATETDPIDRDALAAVAPQLWGEAVRLYAAGAKWHLDESDGIAFKQWIQGREERREDGAYHDEVVEHLKTWPPGPMSSRGVGIKDLAKAVGDMRTVEGDPGALQRLSETLRSIGLESRKVGGTKRWFYTPQAATRINALLAGDLCREAEEQAAE